MIRVTYKITFTLSVWGNAAIVIRILHKVAHKALDFDQIHYIQWKYICFAYKKQIESLKPVIVYITPFHEAISAWPPNSFRSCLFSMCPVLFFLNWYSLFHWDNNLYRYIFIDRDVINICIYIILIPPAIKSPWKHQIN